MSLLPPWSGPLPNCQEIFLVLYWYVIPWLESPQWIPLPRGWVPNMQPSIHGPSSWRTHTFPSNLILYHDFTCSWVTQNDLKLPKYMSYCFTIYFVLFFILFYYLPFGRLFCLSGLLSPPFSTWWAPGYSLFKTVPFPSEVTLPSSRWASSSIGVHLVTKMRVPWGQKFYHTHVFIPRPRPSITEGTY